jgi:hypothetical protein
LHIFFWNLGGSFHDPVTHFACLHVSITWVIAKVCCQLEHYLGSFGLLLRRPLSTWVTEGNFLGTSFATWLCVTMIRVPWHNLSSFRWVYWFFSRYLIWWSWSFELRVSQLLVRYSTSWAMPLVLFYFSYFSGRVLSFWPGQPQTIPPYSAYWLRWGSW